MEGQGALRLAAQGRRERRPGRRHENAMVEIVMATHAGMTTEEFETDREGLDRHGETSRRRQTLLHGDGLSAHARTARLPARQRLQDLHRVRRRHRVHAPVVREGLRHPARAGHRQQHQDEVRDARTASRCSFACPRSTSSTTRKANRSASTSTLAGGPSPRSATPTATCRCCNGPLPDRGHGSASTSTTPMREREWAYDRDSSIGRLDKGLDEAQAERLDGGRHEAGLEGHLSEHYDQLYPSAGWFHEEVTSHLVRWPTMRYQEVQSR